jgi:hypothetical protein
LGKLENWGYGQGVWNERVAKVLLGADSKNLKMRRLPTTGSATPRYLFKPNSFNSEAFTPNAE